MKVVVAGGSGFVGRHVVAELLRGGHEVTTIDRGRRPPPPGATAVQADLAVAPIPEGVLEGAGAIVNLVGIKRASGGQSFEAAHVEVTRRLLTQARAHGVGRLIHISVVGSRPDGDGRYHDTKWQAEALVRESGLRATILRPGVIYGRGDDMITHLVVMIRCAPVFPIVGRGTSLLQPVDVRDVAQAVAAALGRPRTSGRTYDVVGPERMTLRRVVSTVAAGLALPLLIVPTPPALMRPVVRWWSRYCASALSTPSQLRMLEEGMVGDPEPGRRDLDLEPRPFTVEAVREAAARVPLVPPRIGGALVVMLAAFVLSFALGAVVGNPWHRMAAMGAALTALSVLVVPLPWRALLTPTRRGLGQGVAAAVLLYAAGAVVFRVLQGHGSTAGQLATLYAWRDAVSPAVVWPLLAFIVSLEELVWRLAVTLPLAARFGPWAGPALGALAFALAHVAMGVPVLVLAALGAGFVWSLMVVRTGSAVPALVSHLLWDAAVLLVFPYPRLIA
jgi:uncharacterized protein YbjT (DUF2867 family)/membrane protease YdiL (CAAX protease family)